MDATVMLSYLLGFKNNETLTSLLFYILLYNEI